MERLETLSIRGAESLTRKTKYNDKGEAESIELCLKYELMISQAVMSLSLTLNKVTSTAKLVKQWNRTDFIILAGFKTLARTEGNEYVEILLPKDYFEQCFKDALIVRTVSEFKELLKRLGCKFE
jgi:phage-related tail protein